MVRVCVGEGRLELIQHIYHLSFFFGGCWKLLQVLSCAFVVVVVVVVALVHVETLESTMIPMIP